jgi:hypothetical protein
MITSVTIPDDNVSEFEHALTVVMGYEIKSRISVPLHIIYLINVKNKTDEKAVQSLAEQFKN